MVLVAELPEPIRLDLLASRGGAAGVGNVVPKSGRAVPRMLRESRPTVALSSLAFLRA